MTSIKRTARLAGLLYLILAITGGFGIMYVPSQLIVLNDPATTVSNIFNNEFLYRLGILSQLACQAVFVYLVLVLYKLLKEFDIHQARIMVGLVIASISITFISMTFLLAPLHFLQDPAITSSFETTQLNSMYMLFFQLYNQGIVVVQIFWGLWLIPFGILMNKSSYAPKWIGFFLIVGGAGYVITSIAGVLFPANSKMIETFATLPSVVGEFSAILWFLIKGVRE